MTIQAKRVLQVAGVDMAVKNLLIPLMISLRDQGFDVEAAANNISGAREDIGSLGFEFHNLDMERNLSPVNVARSFVQIYSLLKRKSYDAVHLHTPLAAFIGRFAAKAAGVPVVLYTAHGFYFHEGMPGIKRRIFECLEYAAGRAVTDFLFCQSMEDTESALSLGFVHPSNILHIGNGVDFDRFRADIEYSAVVKRELGIPPGSVVITFMGRVVKEKGVTDLVEAFLRLSERHRDCVLLIAGDCDSAGDRDRKTIENIRRIANSPGSAGRIRLMGFRSDPEKILLGSDIFVLPSYREGLPRSICEAMSCGLPVIASNIRGCREQVTHGESGYLFPAGDIEKLTWFLEDLMKHRGKRIGMGRNGRIEAKQRFDERNVISRQIDIYKRLLSDGIPASEEGVRGEEGRYVRVTVRS